MTPPTNRHQKRQRCKARRRERKRWPRRCQCGKTWTREAWEALPEVGPQDFGRHRGSVLDLRNCVCRSTMTVRAVWLESEAA